jgi:hypothetical protein
MTKTSIVSTYSAMVLLLATTAFADTVHLRSGETLEGTVSAESYTISTPSRGDLVIPIASISALRFSESVEVVVKLIDGTELEGSLETETIMLDQGLFSRSLEIGEVAEIEITERTEPATVPKDTPVTMMLAQWIDSKSAKVGQRIRLCVAEDVAVNGKVAVRKGTPAFGEVTISRGARGLAEHGEIALEPHHLMLPGGVELPVVGATAEYDGGFDAGAFVGGGVVGLLSSGKEVKVPPGTILEVATREERTVQAGTTPPGDDLQAWEQCDRFFRFDGVEVVPVEEVDRDGVYAPFGTSLTVSLPLTELAELDEGEPLDQSFRNLIAFDTFIHAISLSVDRGRKRVKLPVHLFLSVLPSHDKYVDLTLSVVDGEDVLAEESVQNVDAEEAKSKQVRMELTADSERFDQALADGGLRLRIAMEVKE